MCWCGPLSLCGYSCSSSAKPRIVPLIPSLFTRARYRAGARRERNTPCQGDPPVSRDSIRLRQRNVTRELPHERASGHAVSSTRWLGTLLTNGFLMRFDFVLQKPMKPLNVTCQPIQVGKN